MEFDGSKYLLSLLCCVFTLWGRATSFWSTLCDRLCSEFVINITFLLLCVKFQSHMSNIPEVMKAKAIMGQT